MASVAHFTHDGLNLGFGAYFHSIDQNAGRSIQGYSSQFCSGH